MPCRNSFLSKNAFVIFLIFFIETVHSPVLALGQSFTFSQWGSDLAQVSEFWLINLTVSTIISHKYHNSSLYIELLMTAPTVIFFPLRSANRAPQKLLNLFVNLFSPSPHVSPRYFLNMRMSNSSRFTAVHPPTYPQFTLSSPSSCTGRRFQLKLPVLRGKKGKTTDRCKLSPDVKLWRQLS